MEDGMIINKSSYERGFAHGTLYKMYDINLIPKTTMRNVGPTSFIKNTDEFGAIFNPALDKDGLP
jgi:DNA-directed RNA polymerase I subunit RPA2